MTRKGTAQTICNRGHSMLDPDNVYTDKTGKRHCRACMRWRARNRGEVQGVRSRRPAAWYVAPEGQRRCGACEEFRSVDDFYKGQGRCISCSKKTALKYIEAQGGHRVWNLLRKYGITLEEYETLLEKQNGGCAICGAGPETTRHGVLPVDHCHDTKKVRGLLCEECNFGVGKFQDDPARLRKAADYLEGVL